MKPEYGLRRILWNLGLVPRSDFEAEYDFRRQCQEKSYKYFYKTIELEEKLNAKEENMDYLDIVEVDSVDAAEIWLSDDDPCVGQIIALNLTKGISSKDLREAADTLDSTCCGYNEGVFRINGELWFIGCDFGH